MGKNFLIVYDYYIVTTTGKVHFGINYILEKFLQSKRSKYKVLKQELNANISNILLIKLPNIFKTISKENFSDIICYNNLNSVIVSILKIILRRKYRVVFVSLDFSKKRFGNYILDKIYILVDYLASILSNETWSCSYKIFEYRKKFLSDTKNFYIPNIPNYNKQGLKKFKRFTIVMTSFLSENYLFEEVYTLLDYLKDKDLYLYIIGEGYLRNEIEKKIKYYNVSDKVTLTGYLEHDEVKKILERSHLGLALYSGKSDLNNWGDSLKIREYLYYNLPVITTDIVYNHREVLNEKLGMVINEKKNLVNLVNEIFINKNLYEDMVKATVSYNSKNNIDKLFSDRLA